MRISPNPAEVVQYKKMEDRLAGQAIGAKIRVEIKNLAQQDKSHPIKDTYVSHQMVMDEQSRLQSALQDLSQPATQASTSADVIIDRVEIAPKAREIQANMQRVSEKMETAVQAIMNDGSRIAEEARVHDVDMAKEMMQYTKQNILNQAATSMLAQANQSPCGVLQLLR